VGESLCQKIINLKKSENYQKAKELQQAL